MEFDNKYWTMHWTANVKIKCSIMLGQTLSNALSSQNVVQHMKKKSILVNLFMVVNITPVHI
jgi:hypothetical protein